MENPIKIHDLGGPPLFLETSKWETNGNCQPTNGRSEMTENDIPFFYAANCLEHRSQVGRKLIFHPTFGEDKS